MPQSFTSTDMTRRPYRTIWKLAWPQLLMMLLHFFIGFADVKVAGMLDREVQASLGIITQSLFFFLIVAIAAANGAVAAISQSEGAGLPRRVQRYTGLCIQIALGAGLLFVVLGLPLKGLLLRALQVPESMFPVTEYFLEVYLLLLPPYYALIITNAVFRAQKRVLFPLYAMGIVTGVNAVMDFGLGLGLWGLPQLGFKGLAWATFGSVTAGAAFNLLLLARQGLLRRRSFAPWRWVKRALPYLFKVAWPAGLMQVVWHSGYLVLYAITASLPAGNVSALAGMSVGLRVESILFLPAFAFNMTAGILIGHYLGASDPDEAKRFGFRILGLGLVFIVPITIGIWQVLDPVVAFLAPDQGVAVDAGNYLFYNVLGVPFTLTTMILGGAFNGAGATLYNLVVMGTATWAVRLPLAWLLGHEVMGRAEGIWIAMLCSIVLQSAAMLYAYTSTNWQRFSMIKQRRPKVPAHAAAIRPH